jgi:hypothetical protein
MLSKNSSFVPLALFLFVAFAIVGGWLATPVFSRPNSATNSKEAGQNDTFRSRFNMLVKDRDLAGLEQLAEELLNAKPEQTIDLVADVCGSFNSYDFGDKRQFVLARKCSLDALAASNTLPPSIEFRLIENLQGIEEYRSGLIPPEKWKGDRDLRLKYLYRLWNRVQTRSDPAFNLSDVSNRPVGNVPVPGPYMPGIRPDIIKEPDIRAAYLKAIDANRGKAEHFNLQIQLHRLQNTLPDVVEKIFINLYSVGPEDAKGLESNLRLFGFSSNLRGKIRNEIQLRRGTSHRLFM